MNPMENIRQTVQSNPIVLFMKGTPDFPQCGFSMRTARALQSCDARFVHVDVIADPQVRQTLPQYSDWPTFPQLFINGQLIGGCDITLELFENGELQKMINSAMEQAEA